MMEPLSEITYKGYVISVWQAISTGNWCYYVSKFNFIQPRSSGNSYSYSGAVGAAQIVIDFLIMCESN